MLLVVILSLCLSFRALTLGFLCFCVSSIVMVYSFPLVLFRLFLRCLRTERGVSFRSCYPAASKVFEWRHGEKCLRVKNHVLCHTSEEFSVCRVVSDCKSFSTITLAMPEEFEHTLICRILYEPDTLERIGSLSSVW